MKHRLPFAGKICALVVGCLLVCVGVRGQVDYWSEVGNIASVLGAPQPNGDNVIQCMGFDNASNICISYIQSGNLFLAQWDGNNWAIHGPASINDSLPVEWDTPICIGFDDQGSAYVGGKFFDAHGNFVLKWDGVNWSKVGGSNNALNESNWGITSIWFDRNDSLYVAGGNDSVGYPYIAKWTGSRWIPVGASLPRNGSGDNQFTEVFTINDTVYATAGSSSVNYNVYRWFGNSWVPLSASGDYSTSMHICLGPANEIYFAGLFPIENNNATITGVAEWNNGAWNVLGSGHNNLNGNINCICSDLEGNLYVAGEFTDASGYQYVAKWDGSTWSQLGINNFSLHANGSINSITCDNNGNVYAAGSFTDGRNRVCVAEYSTSPPNRIFTSLEVATANCGNTGSITSTTYQGTPPYSYNWSNGSTSAQINSLSSGTYFVTVTDAHGLIATGDVSVPGGCQSIISGTVFVDTGGTCIYNDQQAGVTNVILTLSGDSQTSYATTDAQGRYNFAVSDTGNYYLYIQVGNNTACGNFTLCGNQNQVIHVGVLGDNVTGNNFSLKPDTSSFDLYLHPGWTSADPGFEKDYWIYFADNAPVPFTGSATIAFKYDPNLTFISSDIPYTSYSAAADSFTWAINNFSNTGWNYVGKIRFNVPSSLSLGYQLHSQFWIYPDAGDCDTSNNYLQYYETVKGSHDPNYKEVSTAGYSTAVDSVLTYTIHYQNTGTDSTYFIVVRDTLSPYLNPATVRNLASSDRYSSFSISGTGVLTWTFLPLSLPAASTDSMASNGFITFSVNRMANTPTGTHITNTASVYFDYNSPVRTNTVTDTVSCTDTLSQFGALCAGDSIYFYGRWVHTPGSYDTLLVRNPCDTFVTIGIVVQDPLPPHNISDTICANDSVLFAGTYLHTSGTYSHIGCDSSVRLHLTVLPVPVNTITAIVCWDNPYLGHDTSGQYIDTFTTATGCDSIRILNLTVMDGTVIYDTVSICTGQTYLGHNATGNYTDTITGINSCDKLRYLNLTVRPALTNSTTATVCQGQLYQGHGSAGTYADTLMGTGSCDSIVMLQLTVLPVQQSTIHQSICSGASYNFNDSLLTLTGVYTATITGANGCDSVVTLHLTVHPNPIQPFITQQGDTLISSDGTGNQWYLNDTALAGDTSNLLIVAQHGSYQVEVTGPNGCQNISAGYLYAPTGISSLSNVFDVMLYPNPNSGLFTIEFSDYTAKEIVVTDMLGQTVFPTQTVITKGEFDLSTLAGGLYFLKIKEVGNTNRMVFKQVLIQH